MSKLRSCNNSVRCVCTSVFRRVDMSVIKWLHEKSRKPVKYRVVFHSRGVKLCEVRVTSKSENDAYFDAFIEDSSLSAKLVARTHHELNCSVTRVKDEDRKVFPSVTESE